MENTKKRDKKTNETSDLEQNKRKQNKTKQKERINFFSLKGENQAAECS